MPEQVHDLVRGNLMISINTTKPPSDAEWKAYLDTFRRHSPEKIRSLIFTDGGSPTAAQRKLVNEMLAGKATTAAVICSSPLVRGVVTALSWFNPKIKVFAPNELNDAFRYLEIDDKERESIWVAIQKLQVKLGSPVKAIPTRGSLRW